LYGTAIISLPCHISEYYIIQAIFSQDLEGFCKTKGKLKERKKGQNRILDNGAIVNCQINKKGESYVGKHRIPR
jgi:hypothetical protein